MNKEQLEKELTKVTTLYEKEKNNNEFLIKQQTKFKKMAEAAGSELAPYKAMVLRLEEEMSSLDNTLKRSKGDKK